MHPCRFRLYAYYVFYFKKSFSIQSSFLHRSLVTVRLSPRQHIRRVQILWITITKPLRASLSTLCSVRFFSLFLSCHSFFFCRCCSVLLQQNLERLLCSSHQCIMRPWQTVPQSGIQISLSGEAYRWLCASLIGKTSSICCYFYFCPLLFQLSLWVYFFFLSIFEALIGSLTSSLLGGFWMLSVGHALDLFRPLRWLFVFIWKKKFRSWRSELLLWNSLYYFRPLEGFNAVCFKKKATQIVPNIHTKTSPCYFVIKIFLEFSYKKPFFLHCIHSVMFFDGSTCLASPTQSVSCFMALP